MTDLRTTNPRYPTLVGTKQASYMSLIIRQLKRLKALEQALASIPRAGREYREKWARRPPRTDRDWFDFWLDGQALFDDALDIRDELSAAVETAMQLALEVVDVISKNGTNVTGTGTVQEIEELLALARSLSEDGEREDDEEE